MKKFLFLSLVLTLGLISCDVTPTVSPAEPDIVFIELEQTEVKGHIGVNIHIDCDNIPDQFIGRLLKFYMNGIFLNTGVITSGNCEKNTFAASIFDPGDVFSVKYEGLEERYQESILFQ